MTEDNLPPILAEAYRRLLQRLDTPKQANRRLLASIYGCTEDLVDDIVRVQLSRIPRDNGLSH